MDDKFVIASFVISVVSLVLAIIAFICSQLDFKKQNIVEFRKVFYSEIFEEKLLKNITENFCNIKNDEMKIDVYKTLHSSLINFIKKMNLLFLPTNNFKNRSLKSLAKADDCIDNCIKSINKGIAPENELKKIEKEISKLYRYCEKFFNGDKAYFL